MVSITRRTWSTLIIICGGSGGITSTSGWVWTNRRVSFCRSRADSRELRRLRQNERPDLGSDANAVRALAAEIRQAVMYGRRQAIHRLSPASGRACIFLNRRDPPESPHGESGCVPAYRASDGRRRSCRGSRRTKRSALSFQSASTWHLAISTWPGIWVSNRTNSPHRCHPERL